MVLDEMYELLERVCCAYQEGTVILGYDPADIFKLGGKLEVNLRRVRW